MQQLEKKSSSHLKEELTALQVLSQDVQHPDHLGKDEHAVATFLQPYQQLIQ